MRYPRAVRGWGPFLPYYQESPPYAVDDDDEQDEGGEEMDSDGGESYYGEQGGGHGGDGGAVDSGGDAVKRVSAAFRIPSHLLTPDWAFLASARIVIDANMRENGWEGFNGRSRSRIGISALTFLYLWVGLIEDRSDGCDKKSLLRRLSEGRT